MKINIEFKRFVALSALIIIEISAILFTFSMPTFATNSGTSMKIEKISNPEKGEGEIDGLKLGGNRETSYAWAMAKRGDYVYIGTNKNILGSTAEIFVKAMVDAGATEDQAWNIINMFTNDTIPRPITTEGGEILKCNTKTGEITKIFTANAGVSFRMAIEFDGKLYFGSYSADTTADNYIYKIDENDNITISFTSSHGTSMRAACIYENSLFFGGVDARENLDEGDEDCVRLAIIKKEASDDEKWDRVADYKDFKEYASDPAIKSSVGSSIWDICTYDGYIYAAIPNSLGIVVYRGRPATETEKANKYGWYWTEIVGKNNGINNIGLADTPEGHIGDEAGLITATATPFVFKDKLYMMNFDNTIIAEMKALTGLLAVFSGKKVDLSEYLKPMYTTLKNPQKLWVYDTKTGKFNEVKAFQEFMADTCNEYLWRTEIYNDELYITTMDSAVLYNFATQFTGANFIRMTEKEIDEFASEIKSVESSKEILKQTKNMLAEYKTVINDNKRFNEFVVRNEELIGQIEVFVDIITNEESNLIPKKLADLLNKVNWEALRMYAYIVRMVKNDTWGFDLIKTSDGVNFEVVTDSGFGDKYNYGGRSLVATNSGLYIGTANPFYGAQLWKITNEPGTPNNPNEPGNSNQDTEISKEELDKLKEQLNMAIQNQEKFEEELQNIRNELEAFKNNNSSNNNNNSNNNTNSITEDKKNPSDNSIANGRLPQAGKAHIGIALIVVLGIGTVAMIKYIKYRNIEI